MSTPPTLATWQQTLPHREAADLPIIAARFDELGVTPETVARALTTLGDEIITNLTHPPSAPWSDTYGGTQGTALIATEVEAYATYAAQRAARARADLFTELVNTSPLSQAALAEQLGITKQTMNRAMRRPGLISSFISDLTRRNHP